MVLATPYISTT
jgi:hypothetical protein